VPVQVDCTAILLITFALETTNLIPCVSLPLLARWRSVSHLVNSALVSLPLPIIVVNVLWSSVCAFP
jgi:hypothetical protein